eukprot:g35288.t1
MVEWHRIICIGRMASDHLYWSNGIGYMVFVGKQLSIDEISVQRCDWRQVICTGRILLHRYSSGPPASQLIHSSCIVFQC